VISITITEGDRN